MPKLVPQRVLPQHEWKWFGHAGHFICRERCLFHLCTQVGNYLVSSIGDFHPDMNRGVGGSLGRQDAIGSDPTDLYETIVWDVAGCNECECGCGMPIIGTGPNGLVHVWSTRSETPHEAVKQHMQRCELASIGNPLGTNIALI